MEWGDGKSTANVEFMSIGCHGGGTGPDDGLGGARGCGMSEVWDGCEGSEGADELKRRA